MKSYNLKELEALERNVKTNDHVVFQPDARDGAYGTDGYRRVRHSDGPQEWSDPVRSK